MARARVTGKKAKIQEEDSVMPDLDKLKELSPQEIRGLIVYLDHIIKWKERPEMYLEPIAIYNESFVQSTFTRDNDESESKLQEL